MGMREIIGVLCAGAMLASCGGGGGAASPDAAATSQVVSPSDAASTVPGGTAAPAGTTATAGSTAPVDTRGTTATTATGDSSAPSSTGTGADGSSLGTLSGDLSYAPDALNLFEASQVKPVLQGFEGRAPSCALTSGNVPAGMSLGADCVVSGRPTQVGSFSFALDVGAGGAANKISASGRINVVGPELFYTGHDGYVTGLMVGSVVDDHPLIANWTAPPDVHLAWTYALVGGLLPPGLALDASTGDIRGTVQMQGSWSASIGATVSSDGATYRLPAGRYAVNATQMRFGLSNTGGTGERNTGYPPEMLYISQPAEFTAFGYPGHVIAVDLNGATLPAGLALDPVAGVISGVVQAQPTGDVTLSGIIGTLESNGVRATATTSLSLAIAYPAAFNYGGSGQAALGVPFSVAPRLLAVSPIPLVAPSSAYKAVPGQCTLPRGVSFDPANGVISGTPAERGSFDCVVEANITNNGISWTARIHFPMQVQ